MVMLMVMVMAKETSVIAIDREGLAFVPKLLLMSLETRRSESARGSDLTGRHKRRACLLEHPTTVTLPYPILQNFSVRTLEAEPCENLVVFPVVDRVGSPHREGVEVLVVADLQSLKNQQYD